MTDPRTNPNFASWFKNSVVADDEGLPLVCYHGTGSAAEFSAFQTAPGQDAGAHFGTNPEQAQERLTGCGGEGARPRVYPVYLSIRNPIRLEDRGFFTASYIGPQLVELGLMSKEAWKELKARHKEYFRAPELRSLLQRAGFDGIQYLNRREGGHDPFGPDGVSGNDLNKMSDDEVRSRFPSVGDSFVVFSPTQIKSIYNKGTWSPDEAQLSNSFRPGRFTQALHQASDADQAHGQALEETGFWGRQGAGCIVLAQSTGRILLPLRSDSVQEPGTWGVWGGAIDEGQSPSESVVRELQEEAGYTGQIVAEEPLYVFRDKGSGFTYYNFLLVIPDEFSPDLNWETERAQWFDINELPRPQHFGLSALLRDPASAATIKASVEQARTQ